MQEQIGGQIETGFFRLRGYEIGQQLACPTGLCGRLLGLLMALVNRTPNRIAIDALQIDPGDKVLELGFGPGRAIRQLTSHAPNGEISGIDQSAAMLAQASRYNRAAIRRGKVMLLQGCCAALPFADATFNKILGVNVAYFFGADGTEIREARRVLRRGGMLALYVSDKSTMSRWAFVHNGTHRIYGVDEFLTTALYGGFAMDEISIVPTELAFGITGFVAILRKRS
jgi:SAM-dependent methyltransferase